MKLTFKITENKDGRLSKDIEKLIKNEVPTKIENPQTHNNKGESGF